MDIVTSGCAMDSPQPIDLRSLGALVHTAEMQYQRQLKTLQALHKQAELTSEFNAAWREDERRREAKYMQIDHGRRMQQDIQAENNQRVAEARAARLEAAARHEEAMRAAAEAKVVAGEQRLARWESERAEQAVADQRRIAALEARRDATYRNSVELLEARRQTMLARERKAEGILRQRDELRQLQQQIKAEEDYLREHQRRTIKERAEAELAGRVAQFHAKNTAKDEYTSQRRQALENLRRARAEELRQRFEYIAAQANEAAAVAEAERQALAGRLVDKEARGAELASHRAALLAEMQHIRQQMQQQEEVIRGSLVRMRQQGSVALPAEVVRSLDALHMGGPVRAAAAIMAGQGRHAGPGGSALMPLLEAPPLSPRQHQHLPADSAAGFGFDEGGYASPGTQRARAGAAAGARGAAAGGGRSRPKSAMGASHQRGAASARAGGGYGGSGAARDYVAAALSPRVGQPGKARRMAAEARPLSASADFRGSITFAMARSPASSPARPATASASPFTAAAGASQHASPAYHARGSPRQPTLEQQLAAASDTADVAAAALASGRYTGVHEVGRPGSRREEELREVLQDEIAKESGRQALLAKVTDDAERARLVKYFTMEREEAKRRILALSNAAQAALYH